MLAQNLAGRKARNPPVTGAVTLGRPTRRPDDSAAVTILFVGNEPCCHACTPPKLVLAQDSRTAIESQYQHLAEAIRRKDVEGILALQSPDFASRNPNGTIFDFAAMEAYTRRLTASVDSVIHIRNVIRSLEERGDTSVGRTFLNRIRPPAVAGVDAPG